MSSLRHWISNVFKLDANQILIDAHVHLHDASRAMSDLRKAFDNFSSLPIPANSTVIMLAERQGFDVFSGLRKQLRHTAEPESLWFERNNHEMLVLAGRQIISSEGLEILGLATKVNIADGLPAETVIDQLQEQDALVVLPWGVGKWLGRRGKIVDAIIAKNVRGLSASNTDRTLFLGDNAGRPAFWPVAQFSSGLCVLPGSDPLPLQDSAEAIGRFGALVHAQLSIQTPASDLKQVLRNPLTAPQPFGKLSPAFHFVRDQARLRLAHPTEMAAA